MTDSRSGEKSLRELEFNDLNIHLYLTFNYETASDNWNIVHELYGTLLCFVPFMGLNNNTIVYAQYWIWIVN